MTSTPSDECPFFSTLDVPRGDALLPPEWKSAKATGGFSLDVYPITVGRYREFVEGDGYEDWEYWSDDGWHWKLTNEIHHPRLWAGDNPAVDGMFSTVQGAHLELFLQADHPVIGVSYYEAEAFAAFTNRRLPTAYELAMAIHGLDGRAFPWGNHWPTGGIGSWGNRGGPMRVTAPVTQFPEAVGPFGHHQLLGNIWQWTTSPWSETSPQERMLAVGGSWGSRIEDCLPPATNGFFPGDRWTHVGFRTAGPMESPEM